MMMMMLDEELRLMKENEDLRQEIRDLIFHCMKGEVDRSLLSDLGTKDLGILVEKYLKEVARRRETCESSSSLLPLPYALVNHVVAPIDIEAHKKAHISCQPLYDFYYDELPKRIDAFVADAKAKLKKSVNENVGLSSDPNPNLDEMQSFLDMLRAQRRESRERNASMEGSHKQALTSTLFCSRCMSPIPIPAAADATTGNMSPAITTAAAADATTGNMSPTTTAPAEDVCAPNITSNP